MDDLSGRIIGAAIRVYRELGPGFLESFDEEALEMEFAESGSRFRRQHPVAVSYRNKKVGEHRLDFWVEDSVVVELKAVVSFEPTIHFSIVRPYLKATGGHTGLLLNFAATTLQVKRVGREWHSRAG